MKKILSIIMVLLGLTLVWYLFIKEYDYRFHFEGKYGPEVVYEELENIEQFSIFYNPSEIKNIEGSPGDFLIQNVKFEKSDLKLHWELQRKNDTTTDIYLHVKSEDNIKNRLSILNPFSKNQYVDSLTAIFSSLGQKLRTKQNEYKVTLIDSIVYSPALDCICRSAKKVTIVNKAKQMVNDINYLEDFVLEYDLKLTGYPFVKITDWNKESNNIDFDFCFPVNLAQDIKPDYRVNFKQIASSTSLKAIYNGNYRSSNLAWYELVDKAERAGYKSNHLPLEIFHNNPKSDVDPSNWRAEVYMPIITDK